ncbi:hypothetical protein H6G45_06330 [Synechocystis sp. FACHB-383]|uniref:hypothetical protein n=1 Tax=Synechocystis sp. FACHB-383 TaxID=2692864 RepID=UPI001689EDB1|nr:hypothetical protein [Synechocystis sp. FACHB-383]MBD2653109.1 hypothetical protein [Synechocystis sp. FACHB-383]
MKKIIGLATGVAIAVGLLEGKVATAQANDGSIMPTESTRIRIRQRACDMYRQGYSQGEINEEAKYIARVNAPPPLESQFVQEISQSIADLFVEGEVVIALTKECTNRQ